MKVLPALLSVALLALPLVAAPARADNVTANQVSAAGHGRRPTLTNRPSREIYHRQPYGRTYGFRRHHRYGY